VIAESRVAQELADTFDGVSLPKMQSFLVFGTLLVNFITFNFQDLALPLGASWQRIDPLVECALVLE
jgi:hypothetical protein